MKASFRKRSMLALVLVLLLALTVPACESPSAPDGALFGVWGGEGAELVTGTNSIRVNTGCSSLEAKQPLVPGPDGRFLISNVKPQGSWWLAGAISLRGTVSGPEITLEVVVVTLDRVHVTPYTVSKDRKAALEHYCLGVSM